MPDFLAQDLSKKFERRQVLKNLSFRYQSREIVCFLGASGCGKSTLLRILAGLEKLDSGKLPFDSQKQKLSMVFQEPTLLAWRTGLENILLPFELEKSRLSSPEQQKKSQDVLDQVGLSASADNYPDQMSGGMKMRISLARALVREPDLMMMDEPFSALDELTREDLQSITRKIFVQTEAIQNIFFVTHSLTEAFFISDRVLVMNVRGQIELELVLNFPEERSLEFRNSDQYRQSVRDSSIQIRKILGEKPPYL